VEIESDNAGMVLSADLGVPSKTSTPRCVAPRSRTTRCGARPVVRASSRPERQAS
jgi:hypothetical protein